MEEKEIVVKGGHGHFGQAIGILTLETHFPRIPGDIGNASSYRFPVKLRMVKGATSKRVVDKTDLSLLEPFVEAARELEADGVRAITTSCGFLSIFQDEMARAVKVPMFTSVLMLVPLVHRMLGGNQRVAILTVNSASLSKAHLVGAGINDIPLIIEGLQNLEEFMKPIRDETTFDPRKVEREIVEVAQRTMNTNPDIGAFVLETAILPPYSRAVQEATGLPVFDIVHFINFIFNSVVVGDRFSSGFM